MGPSLGGPSAFLALARQAQSEPKPSVPTAAPAVPKTELAAAPLAAAASRPVDPVALAAEPDAFVGQAVLVEGEVMSVNGSTAGQPSASTVVMTAHLPRVGTLTLPLSTSVTAGI